MTERLLTFEEALLEADSPRPHLLLGNGFSIAWRPEIFQYQALLEAAHFGRLSVDGRTLFDALSTTDFERAIQALRTSARVVSMYDPAQSSLAERLAGDADAIKDELARVIADKHPDLPGSLTPDEFASAASFLSHFERIYTLNYDLLLYWTAMNAAGSVSADDGFRADADDPEATYVTWDSSGRSHSQRLFYLHGALHLFDERERLSKFTWIRTQVRLIDQVRAALDRDAYPLVVTEGSTEEKFAKINHHAYLSHGYRSFAGIRGTLFIFGHSLSDNDWHVLRLIPQNVSLRKLFVSVRGGISDEVGERMRLLMAVRPNGARELSVQYFDAESAHVWR